MLTLCWVSKNSLASWPLNWSISCFQPASHWDSNWDISSADFKLASLHNHVNQLLMINPFTFTWGIYNLLVVSLENPNTEEYHCYTETLEIKFDRIQILLEGQREECRVFPTTKVICRYILKSLVFMTE